MEDKGPSAAKRRKIEPSKSKGSVTLHNAVLQQDPVLVAKLAAAVEDIDATNELRKTALELAIATKNKAIVKILLRNHASLSKKNYDGFEPLHLAVCERHVPNVVLLLYSGADIDARSSQDMTPLDLAASRNYTDVATELIRWGASVDVDPDQFHWRIPPLIHAIRNEHISMVRFLLRNGANINCLSDYDDHSSYTNCESALITAINRNNPEIIRLLIRRGANVNFNKSPNIPPLHCAVDSCNEDIVNHLLDRGAKINFRNETLYHLKTTSVTLYPLDPTEPLKLVFPEAYSMTALHVAVYLNKANMVRLLLERGADPNLMDGYRATPLHYATYRSHEIMNLLLDAGGKIDDFQYKVDRPLHVAVSLQDRPMIDLLLSRGAKVNQVSKEQPFKKFEDCSALIHAVEVGSESLVKLFLGKGAEVNFQGPYKTTALQCAIDRGQDSILELLLEAQADINLQNSNGFTALHFAIKRKSQDLVTRFLNMGANVNAQTSKTCYCTKTDLQKMHYKMKVSRLVDITCPRSNGMTPLHLAVFLSDTALTRFLIEHGANVNAVDCHQMSPLHYAVFRSKGMVELLLEAGANIDSLSQGRYRPLHMAIINKDIEKTQLLLDHGAELSQTENSVGMSALEFAVAQGHLKIVDTLLSKAAETRFPERSGFSMMHAAVKCKKVDMVKQLVDEGFSVDVEDQNGQTPLFQAMRERNHQSVVRLVNCGANVNHVDKNGMTPLLHAVKQGRRVYLTETVALLVKKGADLNVQDQSQCTPLHYAVRNSSVEIICNLLNAGADVEIENGKLKTPVVECVKKSSHIPMIMFSHVLKMQTLGLRVSEKNAKYLQKYLQWQTDFDLEMMREKYKKEVEKMKERMVEKIGGESEVSIYEVVMNRKGKMNMFLRSEEMKEMVGKETLVKEFPLYVGVIRGVVNRSVAYFKFGKERHEVVRKIMNEIYVLPFECTEQISNYFSKNDVVQLKAKGH